MVELLNLSGNMPAILTLVVVVVMFTLFIREVYPPEVTALSGACALLALGVLPYEEALHVLANPAPWTITTMFMVMNALVRTGAVRALPVEPRPMRAVNDALADLHGGRVTGRIVLTNESATPAT